MGDYEFRSDSKLQEFEYRANNETASQPDYPLPLHKSRNFPERVGSNASDALNKISVPPPDRQQCSILPNRTGNKNHSK